ncbi:hypothetical protein DAPPUDRAFT_331612 [Daphnia pulex]|uniref:Uncharacterized protein n=1 Tax=Daphnia pulex TaxID=6669 RepID=E9HMX7_DAPPU|nr:hypothetical protein DAPPUDRAFT_331612 [Daphnia pulex]|eukprot:EFX66891.1 hypothetical protein DAPPUDRAFT_331612 [Daphnia pulex]
MVKRCITVRPDNPWDNEEIHAARRKVRRLERRWKLTNLIIDKQIMHGELRNLHEMIKLAKRSFLESQILEAGGKKTSFFKLVDSVLLVKPGLRLPSHDSLTELVEQFSHFFVSKINTIRANLDAAAGNWELETRQPVVAFSSFSPTHVSENRAECEVAVSLHEGCRDYVDIYAKANLLTSKTILAHGIFLSDKELEVLH